MNYLNVEIRRIDAWKYGDEGWIWNDSIILKTAQFDDNDSLEYQFTEFLIWNGFSELLSRCYMDMACDSVIELKDKSDDRPILAAIILNP